MLHFAENPETDARTKFTSKMALLEKENSRLKTLISGSNVSVPGTSEAETEVTCLQQRISKLKDVFKEKIREFREACCVLTGYKIDMMTDDSQTIYRMRNIYAGDDDYLLFRVSRDAGYEMLSSKFADKLDTAVRAYLTQCHSIPAFTAHITSELFNNQTFVGPSTS